MGVFIDQRTAAKDGKEYTVYQYKKAKIVGYLLLSFALFWGGALVATLFQQLYFLVFTAAGAVLFFWMMAAFIREGQSRSYFRTTRGVFINGNNIPYNSLQGVRSSLVSSNSEVWVDNNAPPSEYVQIQKTVGKIVYPILLLVLLAMVLVWLYLILHFIYHYI